MSHDSHMTLKNNKGTNIHRRKRLLVVHESKNVKCEMTELLTEVVRQSLLL